MEAPKPPETAPPAAPASVPPAQPTPTPPTPTKPPEPRALFYVISFLVGLFGLIFGIVYLTKPGPENKRFGRNCLLWGIIPSIVVGIVWAIVMAFIVRKAVKEIPEVIPFEEMIEEKITPPEEEIEEEVEEIIEEKINPIRSARDKIQVFASSTLIDTTGIGFDYSPKQVLDQDFSTSWTEDVEDEGVGEWIRLDFPSQAKINTLGIVPGYARDEEIYAENNRLKSFELEFSDGTKITKTLPDTYGMHFVEFSTVKTTSLKLTIKSVYKGSKYNDTCIAELDIWSDYVINKDAQAALNYYKKYKEPYALKPPEKYIIDAFMTTRNLSPETALYSYTPDMTVFIASAQIKPDTPKDRTFTLKWYQEGKLFHTEKITKFTPTQAKGKTYTTSMITVDVLGKTAWPLGDYKVEWYENGKLSKTVSFKVTVQ